MQRSEIAIGLVTPALAAYWSQLTGSREEVEKNNRTVAEKLGNAGNVVNFGICDSVSRGREISDEIRLKNIDVLVIHVGTYAVSRNVVPFLRSIHIPVLSLHLQPTPAFHEKTSSDFTIPRNSFSMAGELGAVARRLGLCIRPVAGLLNGDERAWREVAQWMEAVRVKKHLERANIALLGRVFNGMSDINVDATALMGRFGINCEFLEIADVRRFHDEVTREEVQSLFEQLGPHFQLDDACTSEKLSLPLRVAVALEKFVNHFDLQAVAFHADGYPDSIEEKIAYSMTLGGSLMTARSRPFIAEGDLGLSVPMIIFNALGYGASQTEVNVANFDEGLIFLSHSGPGDLSMADGKPTLQWLDYFHGRRGSGVSCSFAFRPEPVTILSLTTDEKGEFRLIAAEGVVRKASHLKNGNVNSGIDFGRPIHEFIERWTVLGPTHHSVIGYGHNTAQLAKVADILGITFIHI